MVTFGKLLKKAREKQGISQAHLAKQSGIIRTRLSALENDRHEPTFSTMMTIIQGLAIKPHDFFALESPIPKSYAEKDPIIMEVFQDQKTKSEFDKYKTHDDFIPIRILEDPASMGYGRIVSSEETRGYALIYKHAIKKKAWEQKRDSEKIICVFTEGDSMEPTIQSGTLVAIDIEDKHDIQNNKIYAFELPDGEIVIKRIYKKNAGYILFTDNPNYKEYPMCFMKNEFKHNPICGKVIWTWTEFD